MKSPFRRVDITVPALLRFMLALVVLGLSGGLAGILGDQAVTRRADGQLDAQLVQTARTLLFLGRVGNDDLSGEIATDTAADGLIPVFQVWHLSGADAEVWREGRRRVYPRLLLQSRERGPYGLDARADGFADVDGYRVYLETSDGGEYRAMVGQRLAARSEWARALAQAQVAGFALILAPVALWLAAMWAFRPGGVRVDRLAPELDARGPDRLEPLPVERSAPKPLRALLVAVNGLLIRLAEAIEGERRFTGDAAHELRTPLAALRAQLDALRLAETPERKAHAMTQATASLERMGRLVTQLLTLARLEADAAPSGQGLDLAELAREVCASVAPAALAAGIRLSLDGRPAPMVGEAEALRIMIGNLLDNALHHAPRGGRIEVRVAPGSVAQGGGVRLSVVDDGAGVAPERLAELGRRFHRLDRTRVDGAGLGLSIVARIAERHSGHVEFGPGIGGAGLAVSIHFRRPPRAPA